MMLFKNKTTTTNNDVIQLFEAANKNTINHKNQTHKIYDSQSHS